MFSLQSSSLNFLSDACGDTNILVGSEPFIFTSTGYPISYQPSLDCNWVIVTANLMSVLHVEILDFLTEEGQDIASFHGNNLHGDEVSFVLTGSVDRLVSITFKSTWEVSFNFKSDAYISSRGFLLELYTAEGKSSGKTCE